MVKGEETTKESCQINIPTAQILQRFSDALSSFTISDEKVLERTSKGFPKSPVREIDEYFELVAKLGRPFFKWDIIRCAFLWKLEQTMSEMLRIEAENAPTEDDKKALMSDDDLRQQQQFILQKAVEFDGTPFTFQRLCELLVNPLRHYKRTDKYLRALEKNINVVTTITESGERVTGVEPFLGELDINPSLRIEEPFFVQVDECDGPMETKLVTAGIYHNRGNGSSKRITKELAIGDSNPINLSSLRDAKDELPEIKLDTNLDCDVERASTLSESLADVQNTKPEELGIGN